MTPIFIAGPCVIESFALLETVAEKLVEIRKKYGFDIYFKASFDKANRTSIHSFRGPGIEKGKQMLADVKSKYALPVLTDIHESCQAAEAGEVADVLQIPAFLCRQTDLLVAAARTGRIVNIKKAQFLSAGDMQYPVEKARDAGAKEVWLTERGNSFGYNTPVSELGLSFYIIVRHIHASGIGYLPIDDDNLPVIAMKSVIDPRKTKRIELIDLYTSIPQIRKMLFLERTVVRTVSEAVKQSSHFHTLPHLFRQEIKKFSGNGIVAEVKIFQVYAFASLRDSLEHVIELFLSGAEHDNTVISRKLDTEISLQKTDKYRITAFLRIYIVAEKRKDQEEAQQQAPQTQGYPRQTIPDIHKTVFL